MNEQDPLAKKKLERNNKKTANTGDPWIDFLPEEYYEMYEEEAQDPVNHPSHYKQGKYETIDVIEDATSSYSGYEGYLVGNVIKYLYRANFKGNKAEDLQKAEFYLKRLVEVQK